MQIRTAKDGSAAIKLLNREKVNLSASIVTLNIIAKNSEGAVATAAAESALNIGLVLAALGRQEELSNEKKAG